MSKIYIQAPDGRVVAAPRLSTVTREVGGKLVTSIKPGALKPGWSVVDDAPKPTAAPVAAPPPVTSTKKGA